MAPKLGGEGCARASLETLVPSFAMQVYNDSWNPRAVVRGTSTDPFGAMKFGHPRQNDSPYSPMHKATQSPGGLGQNGWIGIL